MHRASQRSDIKSHDTAVLLLTTSYSTDTHLCHTGARKRIRFDLRVHPSQSPGLLQTRRTPGRAQVNGSLTNLSEV